MAYIYIITAETHGIKIGVAKEPEARLWELQTGCPFKLRLYAKFKIATRNLALKYEHIAHKRLKNVKLVGEWFKIEPAQAAALITGTIAGPPKNVDAELEVASARELPVRSIKLLVCPNCGHSKKMFIDNKKMWRSRFQCTSCQSKIEGRRFFIRRVA